MENFMMKSILQDTSQCLSDTVTDRFSPFRINFKQDI